MEDRDRLGQRDRQVEEQRALARLLDGLGPQFAFALGSSLRLRSQELGVQVGGFTAITRRPAQPGAVRGFTLAEQQIVRFTLDRLTMLEPERSGTGTPPAAGRLSPALAGLDVITGRVLDRTAIHLLPDVLQVIA